METLLDKLEKNVWLRILSILLTIIPNGLFLLANMLFAEIDMNLEVILILFLIGLIGWLSLIFYAIMRKNQREGKLFPLDV